MIKHSIRPVAKCRMTQRDKWAKRPAVLRYRAFKDAVRRQGLELNPDGYWVEFVFAVPKSLSKKERELRLWGLRRHTIKPDKDNLEKALLDALYLDDSHCWRGGCSKTWGEEDAIIVWDLNEWIAEIIE
jgi:Holliday junction resolvase RusA-like endonuclease